MEPIKTDVRQEPDYDRAKEVLQFDETKTGVKGLVDTGITKIPRIFMHPPKISARNLCPGGAASAVEVKIPEIDLSGLGCGSTRYSEIIEEIRKAAETWGFFQIVNHGVPVAVMEETLDSIRRFHELPAEEKKPYYSRDMNRKVKYYCNGDLLISEAANWRDSISFDYHDSMLDTEEIPQFMRISVQNYMTHVLELRDKLAEALSAALGLRRDYLSQIECMGTATLVCHYYPACPEPELTIGATKHSDPSFLTILLQDSLGGLQVYHEDQWVDILPALGALVVNIGDLMQLITNDRFKSVEHRVLSNKSGPRISAACFFYPSSRKKSVPYAPIKEFLSESKPAYKGTSATEYLCYYRKKGLGGNSALPHFKCADGV